MRHLNSELHLQSRYLASKLNLLDASEYVSVISCDIQSCHASFVPSADGIYKFLKHVNKHKHTTLPNCKKCFLPDFQLTFEGSRTISHYCSKLGKVVCVVKPCHATFVQSFNILLHHHLYWLKTFFKFNMDPIYSPFLTINQ